MASCILRYVKLLIDDSYNTFTNNGIIAITEFKALDGSTNIFIGKSITSKSYYSSNTPDKVLDGNLSTYYATGINTGYQNLNGSEWLKIDMGSVSIYNIDTFQVSTYFESGYSALKGYRIAISSDDINYKVVATITNQPNATRTDSIIPVLEKKVHLIQDKNNNLYTYSSQLDRLNTITLSESLFIDKGISNPAIINNLTPTIRGTYAENNGVLGTGKLFSVNLESIFKSVNIIK